MLFNTLFLILVIFVSTLTFVDAKTLQTEFSCYNGYARNVKLLGIEQCTTSKWCLKIVDTDQAFQFKSCDPDKLCSSFGNRCGEAIIDLEKVNLTGLLGRPDKLCCCDTVLCNGSPTIINHFFIIFVLSIVFYLSV